MKHNHHKERTPINYNPDRRREAMGHNYSRGSGSSSGSARGRNGGRRNLDLEWQGDSRSEAEIIRHVGTHIPPAEEHEIRNLAGRRQPYAPLGPQHAQFVSNEQYQSSAIAYHQDAQDVVRRFADADGRGSFDTYMPDAQFQMPSPMVFSEAVVSERASGLGVSQEMSCSSNANSQRPSSNTGFTRSTMTQGSRSSLNPRVGPSWPRWCCDLSFSNNKLLMRHVTRCHADKIPCGWCGKLLKYRKDNFDRHLKKACKKYSPPRCVDVGSFSSPWSVPLETYIEEEQEEEAFVGGENGQMSPTTFPYQQYDATPDPQDWNGFDNGQMHQHTTNFQRPDFSMAGLSPNSAPPANPYRGPGLARQGHSSIPDSQLNMAYASPCAPGANAAYVYSRTPLQSTDQVLGQMYGSQLPSGMQQNVLQHISNLAAQAGSSHNPRSTSRRATTQPGNQKPQTPAPDDDDDEDEEEEEAEVDDHDGYDRNGR